MSKFNSIPSSACLMAVGDFELKDNGESARSAPITLMARSGKPIEHWFWGNVVHDLSGMRMSKPRLPIDYCHDDKEIIGYLNHFDISSGDLMASGALVPFKDSDRATEIIFKRKEGVPYQASINFGGDGIEVEEVEEGMTAQVNGYELAGPACIIRKFPLRGVALCPYGADENTDASAFSNSNKTFSATVASVAVPVAKPPTEEVTQMSDTAVEVVATVTVTEATEQEEIKVEEVKPEEVKAEVEPTVEAPTVESMTFVAPPAEEMPPAPSGELEALKAENEALKKKMEESGIELAQKEEVEKMKANNAQLAQELADTQRKLFALSNGSDPVSSVNAPTEMKTCASPWADAQKRK